MANGTLGYLVGYLEHLLQSILAASHLFKSHIRFISTCSSKLHDLVGHPIWRYVPHGEIQRRKTAAQQSDVTMTLRSEPPVSNILASKLLCSLTCPIPSATYFKECVFYLWNEDINCSALKYPPGTRECDLIWDESLSNVIK